METCITGTNQKIMVHDKEKCKGRHCVIHNPSNHNMKDWPTHWRNDRKIMERICSHGVGHPDPDDLEFRKSQEPDESKHKYLDIHGCCNCCCEKNLKENL